MTNNNNLDQGCPTRFNYGPHWLPQYFGGPHGPKFGPPKIIISSGPRKHALRLLHFIIYTISWYILQSAKVLVHACAGWMKLLRGPDPARGPYVGHP